MSGEPSPLTSLPGLRVRTYDNTLKGCLSASWDEVLTTFQWQMPPSPP